MWTHPFQQDPFYLGLNREPATVHLQSPCLQLCLDLQLVGQHF